VVAHSQTVGQWGRHGVGVQEINGRWRWAKSGGLFGRKRR